MIKILIEIFKYISSGAPAAQMLRVKHKPKGVKYYPFYIEDYWSSTPDPRIFYGIFRRIFDFIDPGVSTLLTCGLGAYINAEGYDLVHTRDISFHYYNRPTIYERSMPVDYLLKNWYELKDKRLILAQKAEMAILRSNNCQKIIAWTNYAKNELLKSYDLPKDKIEVIPCPIPISKNKDKEKDNITITFIGGMFFRKGGDIAVDLFYELNKKYKKLNFILISNTIPRYYEQKLKKLENCQIIYWKKDIWTIYYSTDILFLPTRADSYSMAVLEAASLGIPVVMTDIPYLKDMLPPAVFCEMDDKRAFYEALCYLIENDDARRKIGIEQQNYLREHYDPQKISEKLLRLYQEVLR